MPKPNISARCLLFLHLFKLQGIISNTRYLLIFLACLVFTNVSQPAQELQKEISDVQRHVAEKRVSSDEDLARKLQEDESNINERECPFTLFELCDDANVPNATNSSCWKTQPKTQSKLQDEGIFPPTW